MSLDTATIADWYKHENISYSILFTELFIWVRNIYVNNSKQGKNALDLRTNMDPCAFPPANNPSIIPPSDDGLLVVYSNFTNVITYFDPKNHRIRITFNWYIDEYKVKWHP